MTITSLKLHFETLANMCSPQSIRLSFPESSQVLVTDFCELRRHLQAGIDNEVPESQVRNFSVTLDYDQYRVVLGFSPFDVAMEYHNERVDRIVLRRIKATLLDMDSFSVVGHIASTTVYLDRQGVRQPAMASFDHTFYAAIPRK